MSYAEFRNKVKAYARKAGICVKRITFETEDGVHVARCMGVKLVGGTGNNCVKVIWGCGDGVSAVYGRAHVAMVAM